MRMSSTAFMGLHLSRDLKGDVLIKLHNTVKFSVFRERTQVSCIGFVTVWTKTHIYHAIVKSTITYAAETWCLKAKTVAKLNSIEMEFGDARLEFPGRTKLGIILLNKK